MPKPWDLKLTHELSEHEMHAYVCHMEADEFFRRQEDVDRQIEQCVTQWRHMRERSSDPYTYHGPVTFHAGPTTRYFGELDTVPETEYKNIHVNVYPWMDEKHVRHLARVQIEEQSQS